MGDGVQTLVWADGLNSQTKVWTPKKISPTFQDYQIPNTYELIITVQRLLITKHIKSLTQRRIRHIAFKLSCPLQNNRVSWVYGLHALKRIFPHQIRENKFASISASILTKLYHHKPFVYQYIAAHRQ